MWKYYSENVSGNLHDATRFLNEVIAKESPEHEVVAMTSVGGSSIIVFRVRLTKL